MVWWPPKLPTVKSYWQLFRMSKSVFRPVGKREVQVRVSPHILEFSLISLHSFYHFTAENDRINKYGHFDDWNKASRRTQCILTDTLLFWTDQCFGREEHLSASEHQRITAEEWESVHSSCVSLPFLNHTS